MRVDTPEHGPHDHHFGAGAHPTAPSEPHDIGLGSDAHLVSETSAAVGHGLLENVESHAVPHGGHVEIGQFDHEFHADHGLHGLDGLHDSVHHSIGLGFGGDEHHTLHDGLHHEPHADPQHDVHHDVHDVTHLFH